MAFAVLNSLVLHRLNINVIIERERERERERDVQHDVSIHTWQEAWGVRGRGLGLTRVSSLLRRLPFSCRGEDPASLTSSALLLQIDKKDIVCRI